MTSHDETGAVKWRKAEETKKQIRIGKYSFSPLGLVFLVFLVVSSIALLFTVVTASAAAIVYWSLAVAVCFVAFVTERYKLHGPPPS